MKITYMWLLIFVCCLMGLIAVAVRYCLRYSVSAEVAKKKAQSACSWTEYVYWRHELSAIRWSVIPGLTPDRVKAFKRKLGKTSDEKNRSDGFASLLLPSVLGICLCAVCLAGGTYAWFSSTQTVATRPIQAAKYEIDAVVSVSETGVPIMAQNGYYQLEKDTVYEITVTAVGDAVTGYCIIDLGKEAVHTVQFPNGSMMPETITFKLSVQESTDMKITPQWGSSTNAEADKIGDKGQYIYPKSNK